MRSAVLVIDVQRAFVEGSHAVPDAAGLLDRLASLLERARAVDMQVIHVRERGDPLAPVGSQGWELALPALPGETVVDKHGDDDAFEGTDLAGLLAERGVASVVVVGVQSEMCVAATARGAMARGLHVVLPRGGHATYDVPADGDAPAVPATQVSRVAEWSLGDTVEIPLSVDEVDLSG